MFRIHRRLSSAPRRRTGIWTAAAGALAQLVAGALVALLTSQPARAADVAAGEAYFHQHCNLCHVAAKDARAITAPNLFGIGGTMSGVGAFPFSNALKNAKIKWDASTLDAFLAAPTRVAPGTRMVTPIPNDTDRANVVAYLLSLKP